MYFCNVYMFVGIACDMEAELSFWLLRNQYGYRCRSRTVILVAEVPVRVPVSKQNRANVDIFHKGDLLCQLGIFIYRYTSWNSVQFNSKPSESLVRDSVD